MKKVTMAVSGTAMPTASATLVVQLQLGQGVGEGVGELLLLQGGRRHADYKYTCIIIL